MINEKEMEHFLPLQLPIFFPLNQGESKMGEGAVFKMQSKRKMKKTNYNGAS